MQEDDVKCSNRICLKLGHYLLVNLFNAGQTNQVIGCTSTQKYPNSRRLPQPTAVRQCKHSCFMNTEIKLEVVVAEHHFLTHTAVHHCTVLLLSFDLSPFLTAITRNIVKCNIIGSTVCPFGFYLFYGSTKKKKHSIQVEIKPEICYNF